MAYRKLRHNVDVACYQIINSRLPRHRHSGTVSSMARRNVCGRFIFLFLLQAFALCVSAIPLANPVPLFHNITISRFASQNVTSPGFSFRPLDYPIIGTNLVLRITETGNLFTKATANEVIDRAIQRVVAVINRGLGRESLPADRFTMLTINVDLRIQSIPDKGFTYFILGMQTHRRWSLSTDLAIYSLPCASRDLFVIIPAAQLRFRGLWTKY